MEQVHSIMELVMNWPSVEVLQERVVILLLSEFLMCASVFEIIFLSAK